MLLYNGHILTIGCYRSHIGCYIEHFSYAILIFVKILLLICILCRNSSPCLKHLSHGSRFYIDWIIQSAVAIFYFTVDLTAVIFYVGIYLYINAMVEDLKRRLREYDECPLNMKQRRYFVDITELHVYLLRLSEFIIFRMSVCLITF